MLITLRPDSTGSGARLAVMRPTIPMVRKGLNVGRQGFSQDLETGCPKFAVVKILGILFFKGNRNILSFQPQLCIYLL